MVDPSVVVSGALANPSAVITVDLCRTIGQNGASNSITINTRFWGHGPFQLTIQRELSEDDTFFCLTINYIPDITSEWGAPMFFVVWGKVPTHEQVKNKIDEYEWEVPHPDGFVDFIATQFELLIAQSPEQS